MTDYGQGAEPFEPSEPVNPEPDEIVTEEGLVTEDTSDFSTGEGMVALAGIILVGVWLVFDIIISRYSMTTVAVLVGAIAAIVPRFDPESVEKVMPMASIMKILGYGMALIGVIEIITDISFATSIYDNILGIIGALIAYGAYAMAWVGARQVET